MVRKSSYATDCNTLDVRCCYTKLPPYAELSTSANTVPATAADVLTVTVQPDTFCAHADTAPAVAKGAESVTVIPLTSSMCLNTRLSQKSNCHVVVGTVLVTELLARLPTEHFTPMHAMKLLSSMRVSVTVVFPEGLGFGLGGCDLVNDSIAMMGWMHAWHHIVRR